MQDDNSDLRRKQNYRIFARITVGVIAGVVSQILLDWKWFFIIIGAYCIIEALVLFSMIKRTQSLKAELENQGKGLSNQERLQDMGSAVGYAISLTLMQFLLSLITISVIGIIAKWLTGLFF